MGRVGILRGGPWLALGAHEGVFHVRERLFLEMLFHPGGVGQVGLQVHLAEMASYDWCTLGERRSGWGLVAAIPG